MEKLINNFKISFTKGDTYALAVKFKKIAEDLRSAYFTVKENPDDEPLIQKTLGAGIDKIDDREYKSEKTYKIQIQSSDTANLEANVQYLYDLQVTIDNVVKTVLSGVFVVTHSVTGVTSTTTATLEVAVDDEVEAEVLTTPATNGVEYEQDPVANAKIGDLTALSTTAKETIVQAINEVKNGVLSTEEAVNKILNGTTRVPRAIMADTATTVEHATNADRATADANGNDIGSTYATKEEIKSVVTADKLSADLSSGAVIPMYASLLKLNREMESSGYKEENVGLRLTFGDSKRGLYHFRLYREGVIYDLGTLYFDGTYEHTLLGSLSTEADSGSTVPYGFYLEAIPYGSTAYYVYVKESGLANTDWITATTKIKYHKIAD